MVIIWISLALGISRIPSQKLQNPLFQSVFQFVCQTVRDKYYNPGPELDRWYEDCRAAAKRSGAESTPTELLNQVQLQLNQMGTSHLEVWDPDATKRLWQSQGLDTGLRVRRIQNQFVITELVEGGPASASGLLLGDILLAMNGQPITETWSPRSKSATFQVRRTNVESPFEVTVVAREIRIDDTPTVTPVIDKTALLKIPSFVANNFSDWEQIAAGLSQYERLIVDVRGNSGGDFSAMLRGLSTFLCQPTWIGNLEQPRMTNGEETLWPDDLDPYVQLRLLKTARRVRLTTFEGYPCYSGAVTVLVDEQTGSTAEIFAEAFRLRKHSRIWGQFTGGQVVLSVWYSLPLGTGYSVNVPQADYVSAQGVRLEGHGVWPDVNLEYQLDLALQGRDSWIAESVRRL